MSEEWRNSEAQVIRRGQWTKLNGTDAEILIPHEGGSGGGGGNAGVGGSGGSSAGSSGGGGAGCGGASGSGAASVGGGGSVRPDLVVRVRRVAYAGAGGPNQALRPCCRTEPGSGHRKGCDQAETRTIQLVAEVPAEPGHYVFDIAADGTAQVRKVDE